MPFTELDLAQKRQELHDQKLAVQKAEARRSVLPSALRASLLVDQLNKKTTSPKKTANVPASPGRVSQMKPERPKCGIGVFVTSRAHPNCVLLGRRKGSSGEGTYALPGGHIEFGESFESCATRFDCFNCLYPTFFRLVVKGCQLTPACMTREVLEETGLAVRNMRLGTLVNAFDPEEGYHYIVPFMVCEAEGEPVTAEPDKCDGWDWFDWDADLPQPMFLPLRLVREKRCELCICMSLLKPTRLKVAMC